MALSKPLIIKEALTLLHENGLEGVTLRKLAKILGVQAPALYWHFENKAALVTDMAEAILHTLLDEIDPLGKEEDWQAWLMECFNVLRKLLLSHTDGGRVVAGAHLSVTMSDFSELVIHTLHNAGVSLRQSRLILLTATHFTFGHVIEGQSTPLPEQLTNFDFEQFKKTHPTMIAGIEEYFSAGNTVDDLYKDGLKLIVGIQ